MIRSTTYIYKNIPHSVYNEFLVYWFSSLQWPHVERGACTLLLIGDPQLQGLRLEPPGQRTKPEIRPRPTEFHFSMRIFLQFLFFLEETVNG